MRKIKQEVSVREWQGRIHARLSSGQTVAAWCKDHGFSEYSYYYWLRKLREKVLEPQGVFSESNLAPSFCALDLPEEPVVRAKEAAKEIGSYPRLTLKLPGLSLEVEEEVSLQDVKIVQAVLKSLCF